MSDEPEPTREEQTIIERNAALDLAQTLLPPAAILATPLVTKLVNRPPKEDPPKVELPPGVDE